MAVYHYMNFDIMSLVGKGINLVRQGNFFKNIVPQGLKDAIKQDNPEWLQKAKGFVGGAVNKVKSFGSGAMNKIRGFMGGNGDPNQGATDQSSTSSTPPTPSTTPTNPSTPTVTQDNTVRKPTVEPKPQTTSTPSIRVHRMIL